MTIYRGANPFDRLSPNVKKLVIAMLGVYVIQMIFPEFVLKIFSLQPELVLKHGYVWQLVTYSFLHGNGWHLLINLFGLWMFGPHIEYYWSSRKFIHYYFLCVVGAGLAQIATSTFLSGSAGPVIGASGGIYGILIAFGLLFPDTIMYLFFIFPVRAIQAVFVIAVMTFLFSLDSGGTRIAHFAHLGGMLTGFLYFKIPVWFETFKSWSHREPKFHVVSPTRKEAYDHDILAHRVDQILEKISSRGLDSLTTEEHDIMRRYSKQRPT